MNLGALLKRKVPAEIFRRLKDVSEASGTMALDPCLVGGAVRDLFLSVPFSQDADVTVSGGDVLPLAQALAKKWNASFDSFPDFLTFRIKFSDGSHMDLVTCRKETYPCPAALPVVSRGTLETDLLRRDFAVNAMALCLSSERWGELVDPLKGHDDLKRKKLRVLHPKSFQDDPTRAFRAARFAARFSFALESGTARLLKESVGRGDVLELSKDRVRVELENILKEEKPSAALRLLQSWGVLEQIGEGARWSLDLLKKEEKTVRPLPLRFLLCVPQPLERMEKLLSRLNFPGEFKQRALEPLVFLQAFQDKKPVTSMPRAGCFPETGRLFAVLTGKKGGKAAKKWWADYQKWTKTKPALDGRALMSMGYEPGPIFKIILEALSLAKYEGRLKTRADEMTYVIDNFRRN